MTKLRDYQQAAINSLLTYWARNKNTHPIIMAPTGAGKSIIIAEICRRVLKARPNYRILVVSHRKEIIEQNAKELFELLGQPIGIYSAGLNSKTIRKITCANVQSIYKKKIEAELVIVDECHLISKDSESMYGKLLDNVTSASPESNGMPKIVGLTATPFRLDSGSLIGAGQLFSHICYDIQIGHLIEHGYLSPLISIQNFGIDLTGIKKSGFDYKQEDVESRMIGIAKSHVDEILKYANTYERKKVLVFCSGLKHVDLIVKLLEEVGEKVGFVTGEMIGWERDKALNRFASGEIRFLVNCDVLTTGFNQRDIDCIVLLRATTSVALYIQMVGRGSRTAQGKENCLVLDFGTNIQRHGPIDLIEVKERRDGEKVETGIPPLKICPQCLNTVAINTKICKLCGFEFPPPPTITKMPGKGDIVSSQKAEWRKVIEMMVGVGGKKDKPPYFRIDYRLEEGGRISDFLCFEHGGFAAEKAKSKWRGMGGLMPAPVTSSEAVTRCQEIAKVDAIKTARNKGDKYERISHMKLGAESKIEDFKPFEEEDEMLRDIKNAIDSW